MTCPKQNIWHPWKSHPAKGCSCFIPQSSQQNRARASRAWLSKLGAGSFRCSLPLNPECAPRLLCCELCSFSRRETRSLSPRKAPFGCYNPPQQSAEPLWICTDIPASRIRPPGLSRVAVGKLLSSEGPGLAKAGFGLGFLISFSHLF